MLMTKLHLFRLALALAACVPVFGGLAGIVHGAPGAAPDVQSHYQYLSGLLLGIGLGFWSCVQDPAAASGRFRILICIVLAGGLARLVFAVTHGLYDGNMLFTLGMELGVTPLMAYWHHRLTTGRVRT